MDQSLVEYVKQLKNLNEIDLEVPQANIDDILENPEQYAYDFVELTFANFVNSFIKANELGRNFGKKVIENA